MKTFLIILGIVVVLGLILNAVYKLIKERDKYKTESTKCTNNHEKYVSEEKVRWGEKKDEIEKAHRREIESMQLTIDNRDIRLKNQKEEFGKKMKAKDQVIRRRDKRIENLLKKIPKTVSTKKPRKGAKKK